MRSVPPRLPAGAGPRRDERGQDRHVGGLLRSFEHAERRARPTGPEASRSAGSSTCADRHSRAAPPDDERVRAPVRRRADAERDERTRIRDGRGPTRSATTSRRPRLRWRRRPGAAARSAARRRRAERSPRPAAAPRRRAGPCCPRCWRTPRSSRRGSTGSVIRPFPASVPSTLGQHASSTSPPNSDSSWRTSWRSVGVLRAVMRVRTSRSGPCRSRRWRSRGCRRRVSGRADAQASSRSNEMRNSAISCSAALRMCARVSLAIALFAFSLRVADLLERVLAHVQEELLAGNSSRRGRGAPCGPPRDRT